MARQDQSLAPLRRRTIAWATWPSRLDLFSVVWSLPLVPIDHIYAGTRWRTDQLARVALAGSDHFATELVLSPA
jgi:endonuclease/exonuclease/phosphatase (EEP) superfamily protein YafD